MERYPGIRLSHLRQIGWRSWNPLGIDLPDGDAWRQINIAEYDNHLLHVACLLTRGGTRADAIAYLDGAAEAYPCPWLTPEQRHQASERTVVVLQDYVSRAGRPD